MKKKIGFLAIILVGLLLFSNCAAISRSIKFEQEFTRLGVDFGNKDSILRLEQDPNLFKFWIKWRPIELLMTREEKKIVKKILKIEDEAARNNLSRKFINDFFWPRRDDNPYDDDEINEFKENFYDRVVEAQTRFAGEEDAQYKRRCAYGKGWKTDWGIIYILLGESQYSPHRDRVDSLLSFFGYSREQSALIPDEIEVWYYDIPENYDGFLFQEGAAWILFERDFGSWRFGERTFSLFFSYENYYNYYVTDASYSYSAYTGEIYKLIASYAKSYIYDKDLEFEDF